MKISEAKLAQIEAGADPKDVLTKAELVQYEKDVAALQEAADKEADAQKERDDAAESERLAKEAAEKEKANPEVTGTGFDAATLTNALKENGKLEAKVEDLTERLAKAENALTEAKAETGNLIVVAQKAVKNLQVATGQPQVEKNSATEILGQYNDLQSKMASMFTNKQQSQDTPTKEAVQPLAAGLRQKVATLNQQKR